MSDSAPLLDKWKGISPRKTSCQDIPCALLFLLGCLGSASLAVVGFTKGRPDLLVSSNAYPNEVLQKAGVSDRAELWFHDAVVDIKDDAALIGGMAILAAALALIWVQLLKKFVRPFIYLTAVIGILCVVALGVAACAVSQAKQAEWLLYVGIAMFIGALALSIALFVLRSHINLTAVMFEEACRGVQHSPGVFLTAFLSVVAFFGYIAFWGYSFVYLYSVPEGDLSTQDIKGVPTELPTFNTSLRNALYFQVFMLLWISSFLSAAFQVSVAGAISCWYFSRDASGMDAQAKKTHGGPAMLSLARAVTVSAGSLAFGSLVMAIILFVRFLVNAAQKKAQATGNRAAKCALGCVGCCLGCVTKLVSFVNRYAYIHVAMHGSSFLGAARDVFELLGRHGMSAIAVHTLGDIVLLLGKLFGVGLVTTITVLALSQSGQPIAFTTVVLVAFIAFCIFNFFARIVSVAVDTVFVSYVEDLDRNGASNLYCDPSVHSCLQEKVHHHEATTPTN